MALVIVALVGGAALGGTYALIGLGLVLCYRATFTFSFAHGVLMVLAAFMVGSWEAHASLPFGVAALVAIVIAVSISTLFYLIVLQRTIGMPHFMGLVATLGLASVLNGVIGLAYGTEEYSIHIPGLPSGAVTIFGGHVSERSLFIALITFAIAGSVAGVTRFTEIGVRIRAAGQDPILASQGGINVRLFYALSWAVSGALAAIAGILLGSTYLVDPSLQDLVLAVFPVILLGGLDSIEGAVVGGIVIGVMQGFVATYIGGAYLDLITYSMLLVVLLVRPQGLLGTQRVIRV